LHFTFTQHFFRQIKVGMYSISPLITRDNCQKASQG
jgi:hypothetical protein